MVLCKIISLLQNRLVLLVKTNQKLLAVLGNQNVEFSDR